jgi:two-component system CheB/CheR fusion protein
MPRSAEAAGYTDYVLPPKGIAHELARLARHPYISRDGAGSQGADVSPGESGLGGIFQLLRKTTGVDFTHYRQSTILRRIHRRMLVNRIDNLRAYLRFAQKNPSETGALYQDLLINVTSFFRNPRVFDTLKSDVFPTLLGNRGPESAIRIWTPGCASGEETYSVAIALLEFLGDKASETPFQLFGTDVSESSVAKARSGSYPDNIQGDVSAERLRRFFSRSETGYRVSKTIRDRCIFAQHNLLNDPPFSQMDLLCCRNLLIYLEPPLQTRAISLFHYALRPGGYLMLGTSEGVGAATSMFTQEGRETKIFKKRATASHQLVTFSLDRDSEDASHDLRIPSKTTESVWNPLEVQKEFDRRLLTSYAPAAVFINDDLDILHSRGNVGLYLKIAPGRASHSILKMAREGLLFDLRNAVARAKKEKATVQKHNIQIKAGNGNGNAADSTRLVSIEVTPISMPNLKEQLFMVIFQESPREAAREAPPRSARRQKESPDSIGRIGKLEAELAATKEYLQSLIETQEAMNEELQSANEEILSSNEELQSTNEELETAKEELQSANEELTTLNDELRSRNIDVNQINNDLNNLLNSIDIAVIMVGNDLTIRRFTPRAQQIYGLISGDIGRPFFNVNPTIEMPPLQPLVLQVMSNLQTVEKEFTDSQGTRYQLRILPYRAEDRIDGAVITLVNVSALANTASTR